MRNQPVCSRSTPTLNSSGPSSSWGRDNIAFDDQNEGGSRTQHRMPHRRAVFEVGEQGFGLVRPHAGERRLFPEHRMRRAKPPAGRIGDLTEGKKNSSGGREAPAWTDFAAARRRGASLGLDDTHIAPVEEISVEENRYLSGVEFRPSGRYTKRRTSPSHTYRT